MMSPTPATPPRPIAYVPVVGPRLRKLLFAVFALFALLGANSLYLAAITFLEWVRQETYQDLFYQYMFLLHLVLGLLLILPVVSFGIFHLRNAWDRPNRRALKAGIALYTTSLILLLTGLLLTRFEFFEIKDPVLRNGLYWTHVAAPLVAVWLFVLHRLAGTRIRWRIGVAWAAVAGGFALAMVLVHAQDPRQWDVAGPASGEQYFFPSLARTATGNFIPARTLMMDEYCKECHADVHAQWANSVHRFASFNNPAYLFSVRQTREVAFERDGNVQASRFCAGCHDLVPFFSGAFDDPEFDDVNHATAQAGITCTGCHAITNINSPRGNADYTIEEPLHYPFAFSENGFLRWLNRQLVKAKPEFHKKTFLKPLHKTPELCGTCHKVHLPRELNHYKWLRGQNHYDSFLLSGVSGHGIASFYYPPQAEHNCQDCHMPLEPAKEDFGAKYFDDSGELKIHDHMFPSANTAIAHLLKLPESVIDKHRSFLEDSLRVDLFALKEGGTIEGELLGPLRPEVPALEPGRRYLLEVVLRTLTLGHLFTEGTADSNEVWLDLTLRDAQGIIGRSGGIGADGSVDPWSHFVNAYVLDRDGNRIDRRNAQDIFTPLYNHQIGPGAADVVHYAFDVPADARGPLSVEVKLQYRKFDTVYMRQVLGESFAGNDLPILTIASDQMSFPLAGEDPAQAAVPPEIPVWERWNDYGIALLLKGRLGELRQAQSAFREVERLGRPEGPLNLARVCIKEGRLEEAVQALRRAASHDPPAYPWSIAWFSGLVNEQNGFLEEATENFRAIVENRFAEAQRREFDFSKDYRVLNELGQTLFERAKRERGAARKATREALLAEARDWFLKVLELDPENLSAHYNLSLVYAQLGDSGQATEHRALHAKYKPDDNARDRAVAIHRRKHPAADHAAEAIVIYDLQRAGAYELPAGSERLAAARQNPYQDP